MEQGESAPSTRPKHVEERYRAQDEERAEQAERAKAYEQALHTSAAARYDELVSKPLALVVPTKADDTKKGLPPNTPMVIPCILAFVGDDHENFSVGNFGSSKKGNQITAQIEFRHGLNWESDIRFDIKCSQWMPPINEGADPLHDILHRFYFYIKHYGYQCGHLKPLSVKPSQRDPEKFNPAQYDETWHASTFEDPKAKQLRQRDLMYAYEIKFEMDSAITEGINIDVDALPDNLRDLCCKLKNVFPIPSAETEGKIVRLVAFCPYYQRDFDAQSKSFVLHRGEKTSKDHIDAFFNKSNDHSRKIQKGQVTDRANRPDVYVPPCNIYMDTDEMFTINGIAVLDEEESIRLEHAKAAQMEGRAHILTTSAGTDRQFLITFHPPQDFYLRLSVGDHLAVKWRKDGAEWNAWVIEDFQFAAPGSITMVCIKPRSRESGWIKHEFSGVFDLTKKDVSAENVLEFCLRGPSSPVWLRLKWSETPTKAKLRAIRAMNPAHKGESRFVVNDRFTRLISGQNIQSLENKGNVFEGIDFERIMTKLGLENLNESQRNTLKYLQEMPSQLGIVLGAFGVGKTYLDCIVTVVLLCAGRRVKVLSKTNESANAFTQDLHKMIQYLKTKGVEIPTGDVVRWHSPSTEDQAIVHESVKDLAPEEGLEDRLAWKPDLASEHLVQDWYAVQAINKSKSRPHGIPDPRFILAEHSMSRLLLSLFPVSGAQQYAAETGIAVDTNPEQVAVASPEQVTVASPDQVAAKCPIITGEAVDGGEPGFGSGEIETVVGNKELDDQDIVKREVQQMYENQWATAKTEGRDLTILEFLGKTFQDYFSQVLNGLSLEDGAKAHYKFVRTALIKEIMATRVKVVVTTIINSDASFIREWPAHHTVVQESEAIDEPTMLVALAHAVGTVHLSGDIEQLRPQQDLLRPRSKGEDQEEDKSIPSFEHFASRSLFRRLIMMNYRRAFLNEQYRTIELLADIVSSVWYRGKVITHVKQSERTNSATVAGVHATLVDKEVPVLMLNVQSCSETVGYTQSKLNIREAQVCLHLAKLYVKAGVQATDIVLLSGYVAQRQTLCQFLPYEESLKGIRFATVDSFIGQEASVVILGYTGTDKLGFMGAQDRLCVAYSRARDAFVAVGHFEGILTSREPQRRTKSLRHLMEKFRAKDLYCTYQVPEGSILPQPPASITRGLASLGISQGDDNDGVNDDGNEGADNGDGGAGDSGKWGDGNSTWDPNASAWE